MTSSWFALAPSESTIQRITLDFGLRGANLYFQELVVPGIGGVRFVRQLSWALAGIRMCAEIGGSARATVIANAIEALGCKAEFVAGGDEVSDRVLGRRAFGRDGPDVKTFRDLSQREHYVQNTFRASATRALRDDVGLGLAKGGRFDSFELTPIGDEIAKALLDSGRVGRGGRQLRSWLISWVNGDSLQSWTSVRTALSPDLPNELEQRLARSRLLDVAGAAGERRRAVAELINRADFPGVDAVIDGLRDKGDAAYADDVRLAQAFGLVLDAAVDVITELSDALDHAGSLALDAAAARTRKPLATLKKASLRYLAQAERAPRGHPDANRFAMLASTADDDVLLATLIQREGRVVDLLDGVVHKGPLFRNLLGAINDNEDDDDGADVARERTFRLANFHGLLRDTRTRA